MATDEATLLLGHVVGENVRRLRETYQLTQADLARRAQRVGLRWSRSQVAALEANNRETLDFGTLALLALAVGCTMPELLGGEGYVRLTVETISDRESLRRAMTGEGPVKIYQLTGQAGRLQRRADRDYRVVETDGGRFVDITPVQADADLADRLGVRPDAVTAAAERLWGRSLHQERDRRLEELGDISAAERRARRGHVTRALSKEIEQALLDTKAGRRKS